MRPFRPRVRFRPQIPPSTLSLADLLAESASGLLQRPTRSVLTSLGTVLGVGAFVAVLGITATANGQITGTFTKLSATEVNVVQNARAPGTRGGTRLTFPADVETRVRQVNGVTAAGLRIEWDAGATLARYAPASPVSTFRATVVGVGPGYWSVVHPILDAGRVFTDWTAGRRTAVVGAAVAARLGLTDLDRSPLVYVADVPFTVVGVVAASARDGATAASVFLPRSVAQGVLGDPHGDRPPELVVETRLGAAPQVVREIPTAIDPYAPEDYTAEAAIEPRVLRDQVSADLQKLFLLLAGVSLVVGAVGIANTTLVAVLERYGEIGLRRSLGALPRHVRAQFLIEAAALGTLGGLVGTALGVGATLAVATLNSWTAVISPLVLATAPVLGGAVGLLAGMYPAQRASRIEPVQALRR